MKTTPNYEPLILRTHRRITRGTSPEAADTLVKAAAEALTSLAKPSWPAALERDDLRPKAGSFPAAPARAKLDLGQPTPATGSLFGNLNGRAA